MSGTLLPVGAALQAEGRRWQGPALQAEVDTLAARLREEGVHRLATLMDNGPAWVVADLAAAAAGVVHVPLPLFFTPAQIGHALAAAGVDALLAPPAVAAVAADRQPAPLQPCTVAAQPLALLRLPAAADGEGAVALPPGTAKITFTSGTTGTPKGVCLTQAAMQQVADGLVQALAALPLQRHLCALPLAVLLENIAGVMAPLTRGATVLLPPLAELGLVGAAGFDAARFDAAVRRLQPHSLILLPQMLRAWVAHLQAAGLRAPAGLQLVAVGGAAVGRPLILSAQALGLPVAEGYGLSEGASVQTLNLPGSPATQRAGSAGRALPHARLRVAADGEIEIAGSLFAGYLGDPAPVAAWWPTGDLGRIDAEGFLHLHGRKKHVLITAYGRNLSPEWVETALRGAPAIAQAVVFGDGQPALAAVLWPARPELGDEALQAAVDAANATLPDYARVPHWVRARAAFSAASGLATANGRPQRAAIQALHADLLALPIALPLPA